LIQEKGDVLTRNTRGSSRNIVMTVLENKNPLTQKELIEKSALPARTVRYALKRLIELGLIVKRNNLQDMRSIYYFLAEN
jgi:DNA-binding MarR family transcriptional regulator